MGGFIYLKTNDFVFFNRAAKEILWSKLRTWRENVDIEKNEQRGNLISLSAKHLDINLSRFLLSDLGGVVTTKTTMTLQSVLPKEWKSRREEKAKNWGQI